MSDKESAVHAYTDGACRGNPGPGGWGVVLRYEDREREISGFCADTTNNRMEITAAIEALKALNRRCAVILSTDSRYLKDGVEQWLDRWKKNGWRTAGRKPVKNQDLWLALDEQVALHDVSWRWVKGHSGHAHNERADRLANLAIDGAMAGAPE